MPLEFLTDVFDHDTHNGEVRLGAGLIAASVPEPFIVARCGCPAHGVGDFVRRAADIRVHGDAASMPPEFPVSAFESPFARSNKRGGLPQVLRGVASWHS